MVFVAVSGTIQETVSALTAANKPWEPPEADLAETGVPHDRDAPSHGPKEFEGYPHRLVVFNLTTPFTALTWRSQQRRIRLQPSVLPRSLEAHIVRSTAHVRKPILLPHATNLPGPWFGTSFSARKKPPQTPTWHHYHQPLRKLVYRANHTELANWASFAPKLIFHDLPVFHSSLSLLLLDINESSKPEFLGKSYCASPGILQPNPHRCHEPPSNLIPPPIRLM